MNALHNIETFVHFVHREGPGHRQQPVCHAISRETGPASTAASPCLRAATPKFHGLYPTFISKKKTSEKGLCYVSHFL